MKIAVLSTALFDRTVGGIENHIRFVSKELLKRGHDVKVFRPQFDQNSAEGERTVDGITIKSIALPGRLFNLRQFAGGGAVGMGVAYMRKLSFSLGASAVSKAIKNWNPDLVWQHDFASSWLASRLLSRKFPVVLTNHTGEYLVLTKMPFGSRILWLLLKHYALVIGPSRELTPGRSITPAASYVPNGVDTTFFTRPEKLERNALRRKLLGVEDEFVLLCPRRWAPTKGIAVFARALKLLDNDTEWTRHGVVVFAGDGYPDYPRYVQEVEALLRDVRVRVVRLGNVPVYQLRDYYQSADLVVIPSLLEAVSLSALEAMACGVPVLATRVGGMPELITDSSSGYLVPPGDEDALASKIRTASLDSEREELVATALRLVTDSYSWQVIGTRLEELLEETLRKWRTTS